MNRTPLRSTQIKSLGYDAGRRLMEVELTGGTIMAYSGVSQSVYDGLLRASNPQSYYRDRIEEEFTGIKIK
ncbi:MAG: hypothetical protein RLZZ502_1745 [Pseudomonadota bacterium]|jgi:hypothetical protein